MIYYFNNKTGYSHKSVATFLQVSEGSNKTVVYI